MASSAVGFYRIARSLIANDGDLPDFFAYHLTVDLKQASATVRGIRECYEACDLVAPTWLASHFSKGLNKPRRFIKVDGGYRLESARREEIAGLLGVGTPDSQTSATLNRLEGLIQAGPKREFLHETIKCFNAGANRASIVMCWNLAVHHLQEHVMSDTTRLAAFDACLAKSTDKRIRITAISKQDDFSEMPEGKFLEFCREAKIISSSIFNKLKSRLDERNAAAHPSGVSVKQKAAEVYVEDLVDNVLLKYST